MKKQNKKYALFVGGETAGPVFPLLALAKQWVDEDPNLVPIFVDRRRSVAAHVIPKNNFKFKAISAGKLRRYWSFKNLLSPLQIAVGFLQAMFLLIAKRPKIVVGAGGYVQVPVIFAAWILRIPRLIHQQDVVPTFSNRLVGIFVNKITTTFEKSTKDFPQGTGLEKDYENFSKVVWTGNPSVLDTKLVGSKKAKDEAIELFHLDKKWPTVFILGGGSGAQGLNNMISRNLKQLLKVAQVIHSTGSGKQVEVPHDDPEIHDRYHQYEFINRMDLAYSAADIVIARGGIGTITELSKIGMPSIIIPMPDSHQEENALLLYDTNSAIIIDQNDPSDDILAKAVRKVFFDAKLQQDLCKNIMKLIPENSTQNMLKVVKEVANN